MRSAFRAVAVTIFVLAACRGETPAPGSDGSSAAALPDGSIPAAMILAIDSAMLSKLALRKGTWSEADSHSEWRAYLSDGKVRYIDEYMSVGENSARRLQHYFTIDGQLAAFVETRDQMVFTRDRPPVREIVNILMHFKGEAAISTSKVVDGVAKPIEAFEVETVRKHSMAVFQLAAAAPATAPGTSPAKTP